MMSDQKLSKIEKLKLKREQLNTRIKQVSNREHYKARRLDARRNMLVGVYFLAKAKQEGTLEEIYQLMDAYLKHKADR